jgi:hypothetical protein
MNELDPMGFKSFYDSLESKDGLAAPVRMMNADTLVRFLMDAGVKSISTMDKATMAQHIIKSPRMLYDVLGGTARGTVIDPQYGQLQAIDLGVDKAYFRESPLRMVNARRADFWTIQYFISGQPRQSIEISSRSVPADLDGVPQESTVVLQSRTMSAQAIEMPPPTIDLVDKKIKEMAEELNIDATNERDAMIKKILANYQNPIMAESHKGERIYFSFDGPIAIGKPLTKEEVLGLAHFIKVRSSSKIVERKDSYSRSTEVVHLFDGVVDPTVTHQEQFASYFKAKQRVWAVFADLKLD